MTAAELLKPRFEVIAEYPRCDFKKGTILTLLDGLFYTDGTDCLREFYILPYPHLFKPLNWWERRTVEQMPKRLVSNMAHNKGEIKEVEIWQEDNSMLFVFFNKKKRDYACTMNWTSENCYLPID